LSHRLVDRPPACFPPPPDEEGGQTTKRSGKKGSLNGRSAVASLLKKDKPRTLGAKINHALFGWLDNKVKVGARLCGCGFQGLGVRLSWLRSCGVCSLLACTCPVELDCSFGLPGCRR
jgi:hypothetical protein